MKYKARALNYPNILVFAVLIIIMPFQRAALATPPPEQVPAICTQTLCALVVPEASTKVMTYSTSLDISTGAQWISAKLSSGVIVHVVSKPIERKVHISNNSEFHWDRRLPTLAVASSCLLCSGLDKWSNQAVGISIYGSDLESVDSFIQGGGIRLWAFSTSGPWNGVWRDLPLGPTNRVDFPTGL